MENLLNNGSEGAGKGQHAQQAALDEVAEKTRTDAWNRLGDLIEDAKLFADSKPNIHRELKVKLANIGLAYRRLKKLEYNMRGKRQRPSSAVTKDAQTSPIPAASYVRIVAESRLMGVDDTGSDGDGESTDRLSARRNSKRKKRESPGTTDSLPKRKKESGLSLYNKGKPLHPRNNREKKGVGLTATSGDEARHSNKKITDWQLVQSKSDRKKKQPQDQLSKQPAQQPKTNRSRRSSATRPNALIIRLKEKSKYADILARVKKDVPDEQARSTMDKIRRTESGDLLIVLTKQNTDGGKGLHKTIADLLKDDAEVVSKEPQEDLEIRDLDDTTTKEEILAAIKKAAGEEYQIPEDAIRSVRNAYRGTKIALVTLTVPIAEKVLGEHGKIRIGWVNCRIRAVERPTRCFKCWHYGHLSNHCKSNVDRSKHCIKCGEEGHRADKCEKAARCALCVEKGNTETSAHVAGSSRCPVYRAALQNIQEKPK